ncbi:Leucine carboxyl methyltransferase 2, partial [Stegodyphus mimosarum]
MGWSKCVATDMFSFFMNFPIEEKERIKTLEVFDEYEMWHEKCHHYVMIWACQGTVSVPHIFQPKILANTCFNTSDTKVKKLKWKLKQADVLLHRFGHQTVLLSPSYLLISGGFGEHEKKHERLSGIIVYDLISEKCSSVSFLDDQNLLGKRMFHTATKLHNGNIVIIGGRSAPYKANGNVIVLSRNLQSEKEQTIYSTVKTIEPMSEALNNVFVFTVQKCIAFPLPTWRHSASLVHVEGIEKIVVFGGCTANQICTDSCYVLNTHTWSWTQICSQEHSPSSRHSHSSVAYEKKTVIITGGLSGDETILNSVHAFDAEKCQWSTLQISGLLPRYSHTSHVWENYIILVGGVTSLNGFTLGIGIINLITLMAIEISSPIQDPEYPILLCNHCSCIYEDHILIIGGGGNCF